MTKQTASRRLVTVLVLGMLLAAAPSAMAGAINVDGVIVRYSGNFDAYYNSNDVTLTIEILEDGGALTVTATPSAKDTWGEFVDISILGSGYDVPVMNLKGRLDAPFFVTGVVSRCDTFSLKNGAVGATETYGSAGIYTELPDIPRSIKILNGWANGGVLDYPPPAGRSAKGLVYRAPLPGAPTKKEMVDRIRRGTEAK